MLLLWLQALKDQLVGALQDKGAMQGQLSSVSVEKHSLQSQLQSSQDTVHTVRQESNQYHKWVLDEQAATRHFQTLWRGEQMKGMDLSRALLITQEDVMKSGQELTKARQDGSKLREQLTAQRWARFCAQLMNIRLQQSSIRTRKLLVNKSVALSQQNKASRQVSNHHG